MAFGKNGLFGALEAGELDGGVGTAVPPAEVDVAAADAMTEVVEADSAVNEEGVAIESLALAIEEAIDDAEQAEQVVEQVAEVAEMPVEETAENADQGEGLGEGEAVLAEEAFRLVFRKLGGSVTKSRIVPGMESFKSSNSRRTATRLAMENALDTIKAVWERIIAAIKSLWEKIKGFFKKLLDGNLSLEKAAKAMKEKVKGIKNKNTKGSESDFVDAGIWASFPKNGTVDVAAIKGYLDAHGKFIAQYNQVPSVLEELNTVAALLAEGKFKSNENEMTDIAAGFSNMFGIPEIGNKVKSGAVTDVESKGTIVLTGGKVVEVRLNIEKDQDENGDEKVETTSYKMSYQFVEMDNKPSSDKNMVDIATTGELASLCDTIIQFAKDNGKMVQNLEKAEKTVKKLTGNLEKLVINDGQGGELTGKDLALAKRSYRNGQKLVSLTTNQAGSFGTAIASMNIRAGKAALRYVSACASKYA